MSKALTTNKRLCAALQRAPTGVSEGADQTHPAFGWSDIDRMSSTRHQQRLPARKHTLFLCFVSPVCLCVWVCVCLRVPLCKLDIFFFLLRFFVVFLSVFLCERAPVSKKNKANANTNRHACAHKYHWLSVKLQTLRLQSMIT